MRDYIPPEDIRLGQALDAMAQRYPHLLNPYSPRQPEHRTTNQPQYRAVWTRGKAYLDGRSLPCGSHIGAWDTFVEVHNQERKAIPSQRQAKCTPRGAVENCMAYLHPSRRPKSQAPGFGLNLEPTGLDTHHITSQLARHCENKPFTIARQRMSSSFLKRTIESSGMPDAHYGEKAQNP